MRPAARVSDNVVHPLPPVLTPGPGSLDVLIGLRPAWRGVPAAAAASLLSAKAGSPAEMARSITAAAGAADIHGCAHGPGVVIDGSQSVLINNLPACRMGDTILEAGGPPNKIALGEISVLIGG